MGAGACGWPARTVTIPLKPELHWAKPLGLTVAPELINPAQWPVGSPMHHMTSWLVSCTGEGGWLNVPDAMNCTWSLGQLWASAALGVTLTETNSRAPRPPHPAMRMMGSTTRVLRIASFIESLPVLIYAISAAPI